MPHVLKYGVLAEASQQERDVLRLADEYRLARYTSHLTEHRDIIDFRNEQFPELWDALQKWENAKAYCYAIGKRIKQHHSAVRDRNAVTNEDAAQLEQWRKRESEYKSIVRNERKRWYAFQAVYRAAFRCAADWKNVKTVEKRVAAYEHLDWPILLWTAERASHDRIAAESDDGKRERLQKQHDSMDWDVDPAMLDEYAAILLKHDMNRRKLSREYQGRGLSSGTRGEIDAATKPKLSRTGPGTRYEYRPRPLPKPWAKLVLQFAGGLRVGDALDGKSRMFQLEPHPRKNSFRASMQLGTKEYPLVSTFVFRAHRPLLRDDIIQRAALVIEQRPDDTDDGRWTRTLHLTVKRDLPAKCHGTEPLHVQLKWTRRKTGIEVAEFRSPLVNERLIIPDWVLQRRMLDGVTQAVCDAKANDLLEERGVDVSALKPSGVAALSEYLAEHDDYDISHWDKKLRRRLRKARNVRSATIRCIESIYHTVSCRMAALHGSVCIKDIDLAKIKRYDTRDLLRPDILPRASRTLLHAVAPGKLKEYLSRDMPSASGEVDDEPPVVARESDVFTTYVDSLGPNGGRWVECETSLSHTDAELVDV